MSIGELATLYRDGELDIHPEFQRFYRWNDYQKSRLIESLFLGIPIPSIFVSQRDDGVWDIIDGLQRISTIFQFMGILKNENNGIVTQLVLQKTKILTSLAGKVWENPSDGQEEIGKDNQLLIKRSKIDIKIILRESDSTSKYELFQRLNTGGSTLSDQELRNCLLIMANKNFYEWIVKLSAYNPFQICVPINQRQKDEQYLSELVTRFVVLHDLDYSKDSGVRTGDVGEFIDDKIISMAKDEGFQFGRFESAFNKTFDTLSSCLGEHSFKKYDATRRVFSGAFLISAFEAVAMGLGWHYANNASISLTDAEIVEKVKSMWSDSALLHNVLE